MARVWDWLKRNWQWILLPVGLLLLVWRLLPARKTVVVPSLLAANGVAEKARVQATKAAEAAEIERRKRTSALVYDYEQTVGQLTEKQKEKAEELRDDPAALTSFLQQVGNSIRQQP